MLTPLWAFTVNLKVKVSALESMLVPKLIVVVACPELHGTVRGNPNVSEAVENVHVLPFDTVANSTTVPPSA